MQPWQDRNQITDLDWVAAQKAEIQKSAQVKLDAVKAGKASRIRLSDFDDAMQNASFHERITTKARWIAEGKIVPLAEEGNLNALEAQALIDHLTGADQRGEKRLPDVLVDPRLLKALKASGLEQCEDGDRLSAAQMERLMADKSIADRIFLKHMLAESGLMPRL